MGAGGKLPPGHTKTGRSKKMGKEKGSTLQKQGQGEEKKKGKGKEREKEEKGEKKRKRKWNEQAQCLQPPGTVLQKLSGEKGGKYRKLTKIAIV